MGVSQFQAFLRSVPSLPNWQPINNDLLFAMLIFIPSVNSTNLINIFLFLEYSQYSLTYKDNPKEKKIPCKTISKPGIISWGVTLNKRKAGKSCVIDNAGWNLMIEFLYISLANEVRKCFSVFCLWTIQICTSRSPWKNTDTHDTHRCEHKCLHTHIHIPVLQKDKKLI